jgi:hypothetical protein
MAARGCGGSLRDIMAFLIDSGWLDRRSLPAESNRKEAK